jgi:intracellular septation protein
MKLVLGHSLEIKEKGWRILSYMWIGFFLTLAAVNEVVWRNVSTEAWVNFKVFGVLAITFVFVLCNMPIILKYKEDNKE